MCNEHVDDLMEQSREGQKTTTTTTVNIKDYAKLQKKTKQQKHKPNREIGGARKKNGARSREGNHSFYAP